MEDWKNSLMPLFYCQLKNISKALTLSTHYLQKKGILSARFDAEQFLSHVLQTPRMDLYLALEKQLTILEWENFWNIIRRKGQGEPWQYIIGSVEFLDCQIEVNRGVLIPRQETEILVHQIINEISSPLDIWDIGTGSGCIGIAIKKKRPTCRLFLSDISEKALTVAANNALLNQVEVTLLQGDLLSPFQGKKADIIICNPPYISLNEFLNKLDSEVRDWEPPQALIGGVTGFEFYEKIIPQLPDYLNPEGRLYLEIGTGMGEKIENLFSSCLWERKKLSKDWASHDRYFFTSKAPAKV